MPTAVEYAKLDIALVSDFFDKLGEGFLKVDDQALKFEDFILKVIPGTSEDNGLSVVQSDFKELDLILKTSAQDLGTLGSDFLKLDTADSLASLRVDESLVATDSNKLSTDMTEAGGAFTQLGADFLKLSGTTISDLTVVFKDTDVLKDFGNEFDKIGQAFEPIASDFHKLGQDFATLADGTGNFGTVAGADTDMNFLKTSAYLKIEGVLDSDLPKLGHDFLKLDEKIDAGLHVDFDKGGNKDDKLSGDFFDVDDHKGKGGFEIQSGKQSGDQFNNQLDHLLAGHIDLGFHHG